MGKHENSYFGIAVDFPEKWRHFYWGNWRPGKSSKNPQRHQTSNDDLPDEIQTEKQLFSSFASIKESPSIMSSAFDLAVYWRPDGYDHSTEMVRRECEINRTIGDYSVFGNNGSHILLEEDCETFVLRRKFIAWEVRDGFWLNAMVSGDSKENINISENVFNGMTQL